MKRKFLMIAVISCLIFPSTGWSSDFQEITASALKNKLDAKEQFLLVNTLSDIEFDLGHIPGSINIPVGEILTTDKLPQDKGTLIIFY